MIIQYYHAEWSFIPASSGDRPGRRRRRGSVAAMFSAALTFVAGLAMGAATAVIWATVSVIDVVDT